MNPEPRDPLIILLALLDEPRSDEDLCDALAAAFRKAPSAAFVHVHGPSLYSRNPNVFREFLVASVETCADAGAGTYDPWRGPEASALNAWLDAADSADDATMFRVLHAWRARSLPAGQRQTVWRQEVSRRFAQCETDETRTIVFAKMKGGGVLDEATAVALYESAPSYSSAFIRRHMPVTTGKSGEYWAELSSRARRRKDQHLFFAVYRRTVEEDQWARDVDLLADRIQPAGELVSELLRRHPYSPRRNVSSVLYALLKKRGTMSCPTLRVRSRAPSQR